MKKGDGEGKRKRKKGQRNPSQGLKKGGHQRKAKKGEKESFSLGEETKKGVEKGFFSLGKRKKERRKGKVKKKGGRASHWEGR